MDDNFTIARAELEKVATLQNLLMDLSDSNVNEVTQVISEGTVKERFVRKFIFEIAHIRTLFIHHYAKLLYELSKTQQFNDILSNFCSKNLLNHNRESVIPYFNVHFLFVLYNDEYVSWDSILFYINFYPPKTMDNVPLYEVFYNELQSKEPVLFQSFHDSFILNIIDNWKHYKIIQDNKIFTEYVLYGYPKNSIEYSLKYDDLIAFQVHANSINFNPTNLTSVSEFEPSNLNSQLEYPQFAAYFGAINCFKYMIINKFPMNRCIRYAIQGGSLEVLKLSLDFDEKFQSKLLLIALKQYRNDVFEWLLENKVSEKRRESIEIQIFEKACSYGNAYIILDYIDKGFTLNAELLEDVGKLIGEKADYFYCDRFSKV